ncbi:hypothetical protein BV20DRAFT_435748 [Pilatotrama ljubarskyi]|nr:hypothetical protein BV20DRAFT_435748 [Pilatotrama ljubarskyi]
MASNMRLSMRNRTGPQRPKNADENAVGRHTRQASGIALPAASRLPAGHTIKNGLQRPVLTEVTTTAVNRTGKVRLSLSSYIGSPSFGLCSLLDIPVMHVRSVTTSSHFSPAPDTLDDEYEAGRFRGLCKTRRWAPSRVGALRPPCA